MGSNDSSKINRRSVIKSLSASTSICGLSIVSSKNARASTDYYCPLIISKPFEQKWNSHDNDLADRSVEQVRYYLASELQKFWDSEIATKDGKYEITFGSADKFPPLPEEAFNGNDNIQGRAIAADSYMQDDSYWRASYDDAESILILDYNEKKDKAYGDAGSKIGYAGDDSKTGLMDLAFFENATGEFSSGGFYENSFAVGTAFRAIGRLYGANYFDATTELDNGSYKYSIMSREGYEEYADCRNAYNVTNNQIKYLSACTKKDIYSHLDDIR